MRLIPSSPTPRQNRCQRVDQRVVQEHQRQAVLSQFQPDVRQKRLRVEDEKLHEQPGTPEEANVRWLTS